MHNVKTICQFEKSLEASSPRIRSGALASDSGMNTPWCVLVGAMAMSSSLSFSDLSSSASPPADCVFMAQLA
ncbi:hypothetical protein M5D96_009172 [Drosophila gunungcola]|uniref:Uncharacterized protein n=1 Tax=Drosophila gunungcola TaxID=103775 RepID=A0A9P9YJR1_9MUSC|nr:hypothetical protein M5D96_009172 [Drosophila gunungcola]